ncbi:MAG: hypothetical protein NUW01_13800 [Gemmatimonadaceae bacterium]|nr:hypothetical protein [Gemmatimonadaceae bacterium]
MPTTTDEPTVDETLRAAMAAKGYTLRGLARDLAGPRADHKEVERIRRAIYRYLDDTIPDEETALQLSARLDVPVESLTRPAGERVGRGRVQRLEHRLSEIEQTVDRLASLVERPREREAER